MRRRMCAWGMHPRLASRIVRRGGWHAIEVRLSRLPGSSWWRRLPGALSRPGNPPRSCQGPCAVPAGRCAGRKRGGPAGAGGWPETPETGLRNPLLYIRYIIGTLRTMELPGPLTLPFLGRRARHTGYAGGPGPYRRVSGAPAKQIADMSGIIQSPVRGAARHRPRPPPRRPPRRPPVRGTCPDSCGVVTLGRGAPFASPPCTRPAGGLRVDAGDPRVASAAGRISGP
jgi:hypothetical protein